MNKLLRIMHSRKGESMVEILVSMLIIVILLGAFGRSINFASNALNKSREIRSNFYLVKSDMRDKDVIDRTSGTVTKVSVKLLAQNERSGSTDSKADVIINDVDKQDVSVHDVAFTRYHKEVS